MDFRQIIETIILAIVEGVTEFLPVSSTGHMIIASDLMKVEADAFNKMYMIVVQLAAILAVVVLYWPRIWNLLQGMFSGDKRSWRFFGVWVVSCIPAVILGVLIDDVIDEYLFSTPTVAIALVIGALMMIWGERKIAVHNRDSEMLNINYKQGLTVGVAQCMALIPGFSRSAATIMGGWAAGLTTATAADFSFFLAIPIMFGASGYSILKFFKDDAAVASIVPGDWIALAIGCVVSFIVAWLVVKSFLNYLKTKKMEVFAWYRIGLAAVLLILLLTGVIA